MHKPIRQDTAPSDKSFTLYCFPDLSESCGVGSFLDTEKAVVFQRIEKQPIKKDSRQFSFGTVAEDDTGINNDSAGGGSGANSEISIAEIEKEAFTKGYGQGEKAGLEQGHLRLSPVIDNFGQALSELGRIKEKILQDAEKKTLGLAMAIARKIVSHEIQSDRGVVLGIIREALEKVVDQEDITIRLSPEDFQYIDDDKSVVRDLVDCYDHITFKADETITGGGCLIETNMGEIDARIDRQFKVVEELLETEFQKLPEVDQKASDRLV